MVARVLPLALSITLVSCTDFKSFTEKPPPTLQCSQLLSAGENGAALSRALGRASAGSCVLLSERTYKGSFAVPAGVTVASAEGARGILEGDSEQPVIALLGAEGSGLCGVTIRVAKGVAVSILGGPIRVKDLTVEQAGSAALAIACVGDCDVSTQAISLHDVRIHSSGYGIWMNHAPVTIDTAVISDQVARGRLSGGIALIADNGARLIMSGVAIERNEGVGILLNGEGTTAHLTNVRVADNQDRGIWAQKMSGTLEAPSLLIDGESTVERNRIVGLGVISSTGIVVRNSSVNATIAAPLATDLNKTEQVGDGVGFFRDSASVLLEDVRLESNARAAGIFDRVGAGVVVTNPVITPGPDGIKLVIQNTTAVVQAPADAITKTTPLGISAPLLPVAGP